MRVALLSDVHANLHALDAVLGEVAEAGPDHVVFLGDALGMGPDPAEVLDRLRRACDVFVIGNADAEVLDPGESTPDDDLARVLDIARWTARRLGSDHAAFLQSLPPRAEVRAGDVRVLAYHGSPRSFDERVDAAASVDDLEELLSSFDADVYAGGHTHFQFARRHGGALVINPGSVGLAYDRTHPVEDIRLAPFAEYALLEVVAGGLRVILSRASYDVEGHLDALRSSDMPHAEWMAAGFA